MQSRYFPNTAIAVAIAALLAHSQGAHAQSTAEETPAQGTLKTVTVNASADASAEGLTKPMAGGQVARGGRVGILGNRDIMDTPFSSTSYTNELIQDQQAKSVADVLLNDPSVRQARGFGNFQEVYMVRGFPVNSDDVAYNGLYGMLPRQYIAAEFFERVELFRGANTFLNGASPGGSGLGGAVNLLPKRAPNEPLNRVTVGTQTGGQAPVSTDIARRFGPDQSAGIRLNAAHRDGGTGIDNEKRQTSSLGIGLDWHSRNVRVSADVGFQEDSLNQGRPSLTPSATLDIPTPPKAKGNFAQPWSYAKERDRFATFRAEYDLSDNVTAWAAGGVRRSAEDNRLANPTLTSLAGATTNTRFANTREDSIQTGEIGVRGKFTTGPVAHNVVASAVTYKNERRNAFATSAASMVNNIYSPTVSPYPVANGASIGNNLDSPGLTDRIRPSSLAVADTMSFLQDSLQVTLGARLQTIKQDSYAYNTGLQTAQYDRDKTSPVAGIVFKPVRNVSLYANYIEALVRGGTAPATSGGAPVLNVGQVFDPYVSKQREVGAKYDGGSFGASVALFTMAQPLPVVTSQVYRIDGEQRNRGAEFSVYGQPMKGLTLLGGLTLLNAKQMKTTGGLTDGKDAIGVPGEQLNLGADWDVPGVRGLALNARVLHTGKQYTNATNTREIPAWNRLDIGARYVMDIGSDRLLTLRARIDNVANKAYWASTGGGTSNYLVLGAPRTLVVSASMDF